MTAWASWQFREFVFHVTRNVNTASREGGNRYPLAVPRALAHRRRQVRNHLFCLTEHTTRRDPERGRAAEPRGISRTAAGTSSPEGVVRPGKASHTAWSSRW